VCSPGAASLHAVSGCGGYPRWRPLPAYGGLWGHGSSDHRNFRPAHSGPHSGGSVMSGAAIWLHLWGRLRRRHASHSPLAPVVYILLRHDCFFCCSNCVLQCGIICCSTWWLVGDQGSTVAQQWEITQHTPSVSIVSIDAVTLCAVTHRRSCCAVTLLQEPPSALYGDLLQTSWLSQRSWRPPGGDNANVKEWAHFIVSKPRSSFFSTPGFLTDKLRRLN